MFSHIRSLVYLVISFVLIFCTAIKAQINPQSIQFTRTPAGFVQDGKLKEVQVSIIAQSEVSQGLGACSVEIPVGMIIDPNGYPIYHDRTHETYYFSGPLFSNVNGYKNTFTLDVSQLVPGFYAIDSCRIESSSIDWPNGIGSAYGPIIDYYSFFISGANLTLEGNNVSYPIPAPDGYDYATYKVYDRDLAVVSEQSVEIPQWPNARVIDVNVPFSKRGCYSVTVDWVKTTPFIIASSVLT
jgi:hypothetical protein